MCGDSMIKLIRAIKKLLAYDYGHDIIGWRGAQTFYSDSWKRKEN